MNPALIALIPVLIEGIKDGVDIVQRLTEGDTTAEQQALDWLGVSGSVESAIANWKASKPPVA